MDYSEATQAWQAMSEGKYQTALLHYTSILSQHESLGERMNSGTARLLVHDYKGAVNDFRIARASQQQSPVRVANPNVGVALWLDGQREQACQDWADEIKERQAGIITHSDGGGGVKVPALLWWASAHSEFTRWREDAVKELRNRWRTKRCQQSIWPGSVAAFLLNKISEEEFKKATSSQSPAIHARNLCQCYFHIGATRLAKTEMDDYYAYLKLSSSLPFVDVMLEPEYHLANAELHLQ